MLTLFLSGEFLLHIPCCLDFYARSFAYTSRAGFFFLPPPPLPPSFFNFFFSSYTSCAGFIFNLGVSITDPVLASFLNSGVSLTHPMLALFLSGEYLLSIPCWLHIYLGSFSYTSGPGFNLVRELSLTRPMPASFLSGEFLLYIPCWLQFYLGSVSDIALQFYLGSLSDISLQFYLGNLSDISLQFYLGECLLHIPCWFYFYAGNFSYTSHAAFICVQGVCLTPPVLPLFLCGEFLLHIPS